MFAWCELFENIKATLETLNEKHDFSKLAFRSGNEHVILDISKRIQNILVTHDLVYISKSIDAEDEDEADDDYDMETIAKVFCKEGKESELRQVFIFLLFNNKIDFKHNIGSYNTEVVHMYKICPLLPRFLFVEVAWSCGLSSCYYEMLSYAPPWMSYKFYELAADSLQYIIDPYEVISKVEHVIRSGVVSVSLQRNKIDNFEENLLSSRFPKIVSKLLLHFGVDTSQSNKLNKAQRRQYLGYKMLRLLNMCLHVFKLKQTPPTQPKECEFYDTFEKHEKNSEPKEFDSNAVLEKLLVNILNTLQNNVMQIDVDAYVEWTEVKSEMGEYEHLQAHVGALAYKLLDKQIKHDVMSQLKSFACKPVTFKDRAKQANLGELLNMLEDKQTSVDQKRCCLEIMFDKPIIFGNEECIDTLYNLSGLLTVKHCRQIIEFIKNDLARVEILDEDSEDREYTDLIRVLQKCFTNFNAKQRLDLLTIREAELGTNCETLCFRLPHFERRTTAYFNALNFDHILPEEFLALCFEDSVHVWKCLLNLVLYNDQHTSTYLFVCSTTKKYSMRYQMNSVRDALSNPEAVMCPGYSRVMRKLYMEHYNPTLRDNFLKSLIVAMKGHLRRERFNALNVLITLLICLSQQVGMKRLVFGKRTSHVILCCAHVMNQARWNTHNFSNERARVVTLARKFLLLNVERYAKNSNQVVLKNVIRKATTFTFTHYTKFYLQRLCRTRKPQLFPNYILANYGVGDAKNEFEILTEHLFKMTHGEILKFQTRECMQKHLLQLAEAMIQLVVYINKPTAYDNYEYFYAAFCRLLECHLTQNENLTSNEKFVLLKRICFLCAASDQIYGRLLSQSIGMFKQLFIGTTKDRKLMLQYIQQIPPCNEKQALIKSLLTCM